jgi:predicted TIM-barrel fold metal-dependent hydrolase
VLDRDLLRLIEKEIARRNLPILSHVANDAPNVQARDFFQLARAFPETRFVAAHLGVGILGNDHSAIEAWMDYNPRNVWLDTGTLRVFSTGMLEDTVRVVGPDRVCFGSDAPLYWPAAFTRVLETVGLDPETKEKIAWKTAAVVFPRLGT